MLDTDTPASITIYEYNSIHNLYDEHKEDEGLSLDQIHCLRRALQSILIVHQIKKS